MKRKRVTILDVAAAAGVDNSTVSLALRHDPRIPVATRERISAVANRLHYVPNSLARALSGGRSRMIGVMLTGMEGEFFVPFLDAFYATVEGTGMSLSVQFSGWDVAREERAMMRFCEMRAEGVIWACAGEAPEAKAALVRRMLAAAVPTVMLSASGDDDPIPTHEVGILTDSAIAVGIDYLRRLGHRQIGLVAASALPGRRGDLHRTRLHHMHEALTAIGLQPLPRDVWAVSDNEYGGVHVAAEFARLAPADRPTAIFTADDMLARGLVAGLQVLGLAIPRTVSVLGYDDAPVADHGALPITTVSLMAHDHGRRAMELLLQIIDGKVPADQPQRVRLQPRLVERLSCGPVPGGLS